MREVWLFPLFQRFRLSVTVPYGIRRGSDLLHRPSGHRGGIVALCRNRTHSRTGLGEIPDVPFALFLPSACELPLAFKLLTGQMEMKKPFVVVALDQFIGSNVPHHD